MIAIVLAGLLALAGAAPRWNNHRYHPDRYHDHLSPFDGSLQRYLDQKMFDTKRFGDEFSREMHRKMTEQATMLSDLNKRFPTSTSSEGIEGNEYKITIPLIGFDEKDIVVKARKGLLMVQAVHEVKGQPVNNYLDTRTLPVCVKEGGSWSYQDNVLKIVLPIEQSGNGDTATTTEVSVTQAPEHSREEMDKPTGGDSQNADVGVDRGDLGNTNELLSNEIPKGHAVEATTYAVDW